MLPTRSLLLLAALLLAAACSYPEKITDGKTAYQRKQFSNAIPMLQKEYAKAKDSKSKAERAYMLAESYQRTNQYQQAADWYSKADDHRYGKDEALQLARMYQQLEQYDEAAKAFQSAGRNMGDVNYYREQINASKNAKLWLRRADSSQYSLQSLPINTPANDFHAVQASQDSFIFASDRKENVGKNPYKWTGRPFFDFYSFHHTILKEKSAPNSATPHANLPFNKEFHQASPSFSPDFSEMYFTQCGSNDKNNTDYCKIMRTELKNGTWSTPEPQTLGDPDCNYVHPHIVHLPNGGKILYFSANIKTGYGGYDLYSSLWLENEKKWANPRNLGNAVNSKGNDAYPFLHNDTLYFSSDGHPTMGGLDIYRIERNPNTQRWTNLANLQAPVNSGGDDFGFLLLNNPQDFRRDPNDTLLYQVGLLTSNRINTNTSKSPTNLNRLDPKGGDDLYKFERRYPATPPKIDTPLAPPVVAKAHIHLQGTIKYKRFKNPNDPNSGVADSLPLLGASAQISSEDTAFTIGVDQDALFHAQLRPKSSYTIKASKEGFFNNFANLDLNLIAPLWEESHGDTTITVEIVLEQIFTNKEIVLENIYYDYNDDKIRADAQPTLNQLADLLKQNPEIRIQLASHTDCRGSDKYNEALSQRRAESAVKYLQAANISPNRLQAKGFGESKPSADCKCTDCSEQQHQANRRTTFMVLE